MYNLYNLYKCPAALEDTCWDSSQEGCRPGTLQLTICRTSCICCMPQQKTALAAEPSPLLLSIATPGTKTI